MNQFKSFQQLVKLSLVFFIVFTVNIFSQDAANGKKLFKSNCAACHKLDKKLIGPALKGVTEKREKEWLYKWIKNSSELIKSGDPDAKQIFEEYNKMPMTAYPQLSDKDIDDILAYVEGKGVNKETKSTSAAVDPLVKKGKKLFKTNCAACHKLDKKLVGPPLKGITEKREHKWLKAWIKDNNALRKSGDALAKQVFEENNKLPMTAFPQLSDEDLEALIAYMKVGDVKKVVKQGSSKETTTSKKTSTAWMSWVVVFALLLLFVYILFFNENTFLKIMAVIAIILIGTYILFDSLMGIGVDQGYEPIQPIAFSHKVHAGDNKIDCQYCHSSAKHSRTSGVPSVNVCMNCHKSISEYTGNGTETEEELQFYTKEIQKIYEAVGWDPENVKYIENYDTKPIVWTRVHSLPDFAYYNHSQHVTVAGLDCQQCHGPVETYNDMKQFSPLTMAWCLDCHKTKELNFDNKYYEKIHKQLSEKYGVEKVTVADMGGKECGKCHY
jgi:predicted CXXCH cytochrome family protein